MNPEATSWIAFGVATVTMVGGLVKSLIDSRDKKVNAEQAVKFALLEQTVTINKERADNLEKSHEECLENHALTEKKLEKCEEGHISNDKRLSALEAIITPISTPLPDELKR